MKERLGVSERREEAIRTPTTTTRAGTPAVSSAPDAPPGLPTRQVSVFTRMKDGDIAANVYTPTRSRDGDNKPEPSTRYYALDSPGVSCCDAGTQTDLTLRTSICEVEWVPKMPNIIEKIIDGEDAKLQMAIQAQQRDVLPEINPEDQEESSDDDISDLDTDNDELGGVAEEEENGDGSGDGSGRDLQNLTNIQAAAQEEINVRGMVEQIENAMRGQNDMPEAPEASPEGVHQPPVLAVGVRQRPNGRPRKGVKFMNKVGCQEEDCECREAPLMSVDKGKEKPRQVKLRRGITMDTGAHDNVMPKRMAGQRKIRPSPGSKRGMCYVAAGNEKIRNEGEIDFKFESVEGHPASMVFQIANVNKALGSVAYVVDRAYRVVYDKNMVTGEDLSYMTHKPTNTTYRFRREKNIWKLDAIVDSKDVYPGFSGPE